MPKATTLNDRINRRSGHVAVYYKDYLIVWGGYMEQQISHVNDSPYTDSYHPTDEIWIYDCNSELWTRVLTKGDIPPRSSGSCGILLDDFLYVFGGFCHYFGENAEGNSNMLHRLHIPSRTWELLNPAGRPAPTPCDKLAGWVYKDKLYFFGGFGPRPDLERFQYEMDQSTVYSAMPRGWNNQLVVYNTATNCWEWPKMKGPTPSPRAAHAADITGHRAFIFGGRFKHRRTNDLHSLDLETHTWSGNLTPHFDESPPGRSWHTLNFISPTRAVVYGGLDQTNSILSDCWVLEVPSLRWIQLMHQKCVPRLWHRAQFVGANRLLIVGGHKNNILDMRINKDHAEEMVVIHFSPDPLLRLCLDVVTRYGKQLQSEWTSLPRSLVDILQRRMPIVNSCPASRAVESVRQADSDSDFSLFLNSDSDSDSDSFING